MMAIESACIPLPSEIIMPFAGYLVSIGQFNLPLVATAGAIGCNLGSAVAYAVGQYGGRRFVERWGRLCPDNAPATWIGPIGFLSPATASAAVFIARLLPVVRTFIALAGRGGAHCPVVKFHVYHVFSDPGRGASLWPMSA